MGIVRIKKNQREHSCCKVIYLVWSTSEQEASNQFLHRDVTTWKHQRTPNTVCQSRFFFIVQKVSSFIHIFSFVLWLFYISSSHWPMIAESDEWKKNLCLNEKRSKAIFLWNFLYREASAFVLTLCVWLGLLVANVNLCVKMSIELRWHCKKTHPTTYQVWFRISATQQVIPFLRFWYDYWCGIIETAPSAKCLFVASSNQMVHVSNWQTSIHQLREWFCGFNLDCMKFDTSSNGLSSTCLLCSKLCSFVASSNVYTVGLIFSYGKQLAGSQTPALNHFRCRLIDMHTKMVKNNFHLNIFNEVIRVFSFFWDSVYIKPFEVLFEFN